MLIGKVRIDFLIIYDRSVAGISKVVGPLQIKDDLCMCMGGVSAIGLRVGID